MVYHLYDLLKEHLECLTSADRDEIDELMCMLQQGGFPPIKLGTRITAQFEISLQEERKLWGVEYRREKSIWIKRRESAKKR